MRILAFAYACAPGRGSEPGAGWRWAQMLAQLGDACVITRADHRSVIEQAVGDDPSLREVQFVYVDLPRTLPGWHPGQRGDRLYYLLWQWLAFREARRLMRTQQFDVAWHLTLANIWIGSTASLLDLPFVYGPVGGGVGPPWQLSGALGAKGLLYELARSATRLGNRYFNPLARISWQRASLILVQNDDTREWLPRRHRTKAEIFPHVVLDQLSPQRQDVAGKVMLYAGRLLPWKGVSLAIRALEHLPGWRLIICGDGPDLQRLRGLTESCGFEQQVDFRGWVAREEVIRMMSHEASVFVFPSVHDEAGWVVVEAMAAGLPVVCLRVGGPRVLAGDEASVPVGRVRITAKRIAQRVIAAAATDGTDPRRRARGFLLHSRTDRLRTLIARTEPPIRRRDEIVVG